MQSVSQRAEVRPFMGRSRMSQSSTRQIVIASAAICALLMAGASPALASTEADPDAVAEAVASVAPTELEALPLAQSTDELTASLDEGGSVMASVNPTNGLAFSSAVGERTTVTLPGAAALSEAAVSSDGSVTFAGDSAVPSVNVLAATDAVRISTVIASVGQTESFSYDFGAEATVELQDDGSAIVVKDGDDGIELIVADIAKPWATDASGSSVETHYVARGSVLTQVVEHQRAGIAYPVVADPTFDSPNAIQVRVRFNRAETASIAAGGWGGVVGSFKCGKMMPICALAAGAVTYQAGIAQNSKPKRCVQVTATSPIVIPGLYWWVDTYRGGPCR